MSSALDEFGTCLGVGVGTTFDRFEETEKRLTEAMDDMAAPCCIATAGEQNIATESAERFSAGKLLRARAKQERGTWADPWLEMAEAIEAGAHRRFAAGEVNLEEALRLGNPNR